jgi:hypothetical protein
MKRFSAFVLLVLLLAALGATPAFAAGGQVHRPDEAGAFYHDGLHAEGDSPFAARCFGQ